jgi:hypothetical protein
MTEFPNSAFVAYRSIIEDYLQGRISAEAVVKRYQTEYLADNRHQNPDQFELLNGVFNSLEMFTRDPELLRESLFIDEQTMRAELEGWYARMKDW